MVDESLIAYLSNKISGNGNEERIRSLLPMPMNNQFTPAKLIL